MTISDGFPTVDDTAIPESKLMSRDNVAEWARQMVHEAVLAIPPTVEAESNAVVREHVFDHVERWLTQLWPNP